MPTSKLELIQPLIHIIWQRRQAHNGGVERFRVLDVGPGFGKYGLLIREAVDPEAVIDAIDIEPQATLIGIYNEVLAFDVRQPPAWWAGFAAYDLVLLIDIIEHMDRADGAALLERIDAPMLISTPATLFATPEEAPELPVWEQHHSLWTRSDLHWALGHRKMRYHRQLALMHDQVVVEVD